MSEKPFNKNPLQKVSSPETVSTERMEAERKLRENEQLFRSLTEKSLAAAFIVQDGRFRYINTSAIVYAGYTAEELIGQDSDIIVHPDDREMVKERAREMLQGRDSSPYEFRMVTKEGKIRVIIQIVSPIQYNGRPAILGNAIDVTERKQAEEALRESERRLADIIDFLPDATLAIDRKGKVIAWNRAIEEMTGVKASEMLGKGNHEYSLPFYGIRRPILIDLVFGYDEEIEKKYRFIRKEGDVLLTEADVPLGGGQYVLWAKASPLYDSKGDVVGAIESIRDITEHKKSERIIQESEEKYRSLASTVDLMYLVDKNCRYLFMNDGHLLRFGIPLDKMKGRSYKEFHSKEDAREFTEIVKRIFETGQAIQHEHRSGRDGRYFLRTLSPVKDPDGITTAVTVVSKDITERKRVEEALRQSEEKLRAVFEAAAEGITVTDLEGNILEANEEVLRQMGYKREEYIGRRGFEFLSPKDQTRAAEDTIRRLTEGYIGTREYTLLKKDGTEFIGEVNASFIRDASGNPVAMVSITRDITERKKAEETLRQSEEKYRTIFESTKEGVVISVPGGRILSANPAAAAILGYDSPQDLVGMRGPELYANPGQRKAVQAALLSKGYIEDMELTLRKKDGTPVQVLGSSIIHRDQQGKMVRVESIWMDISERKRAEKERLELEARYTTVVEQAIDGIAIIQDGVVKFANKAVMDLMGYTPEETIGKLPLDLIVTEEQEKVEQRLAERTAGHQFSDLLTLQIRHKDGTFRHLESSGTIIQYEGHPALLVFTRDVTKRQKAEEALKQSEEKYRSLVTRIPDVTWTSTIKGEVVFINANVETVLGYSAESLYAKGLRVLLENMHPDDLNNYRQAFTALFEKNKPFDIEYRFRRKGGNWVWLHSRSGAIYEKDGVLCADGLTSDITQRKEMEAQLKEYSENLERMVEERTRELKDAQEKLVRTEKLAAIGQLAGGVGHELRNPLAAIKTSAYFLKMKLGKTAEEKVNKHLNMLEKQVDACDKIITDLLDFSRPGRTNIGEVDINQVVQELVKTIGAPENVEVSTSLAADPAKVMADSGQLERVFSNLISNAIQAMPGGGRLSLSTSRNGGFVKVKVADTGVGIPQENLDKVFEPLFTTKAKGTGLGLAIARALVERQGGTIEVESQVGKGTTFTVRLPIVGKEVRNDE